MWMGFKLFVILSIIAAFVSPEIVKKIRKYRYSYEEHYGGDTTTLSTFHLRGMKMYITDPTTNVYFSLALGYSSPKSHELDFQRELEARRVDLKKVVYHVFGAKSQEELRVKNLGKIERELLVEINKILSGGVIEDILFETYAIKVHGS